jgi:nitrogen fixation-related uncharacterized protein
MNILGLPIFVSLILVIGAVLLFIHSVKQKDFEHGERLSLSPLEDDDAAKPTTAKRTSKEKVKGA